MLFFAYPPRLPLRPPFVIRHAHYIPRVHQRAHSCLRTNDSIYYIYETSYSPKAEVGSISLLHRRDQPGGNDSSQDKF